MSKKIIDRFKNYSCQDNSGFKIAFGDIVVSVAFTDHNGSETFEENGDFVRPSKKIIFTFEQADLAVFNQATGESLTGLFCGEMEGYSDYEGILYFVEPHDLAEVIGKVSLYAKDLGGFECETR